MIPLCDLHAEYLACKQPIDGAIARVIENSSFILGKEVEQFEKAWAERCGVDHCVAVSNCTDALCLSLEASGIDQGYQVLVPAMTVTADAEAVLRCGAEPVICDVNESGMITLESVEKRWVYGNIRAVILVHLHGRPCPEAASISGWCRDKNVVLIEDCSHAHGADVGKHGDFACWSFFPSKILGCMGDAGAITYNRKPMRLVSLDAMRNHGRMQGEKHFHTHSGGNYRMDGMQAAILHAKLTAKLPTPDTFFNYCSLSRKHRAEEYDHAFGRKHHYDSSYYVYAIQHERRDELATFLRERGIATGQHYPVPLHRQPVYQSYGYKCPGADEFAKKTLSLPLSPFLSHEDQQLVIDSVKEFGL